MVVVEEDTAPLVFAGAGAYIPTPATLGEMLLGLEDAQFYKQGQIDDEFDEMLGQNSDRQETNFNVQAPENLTDYLSNSDDSLAYSA